MRGLGLCAVLAHPGPGGAAVGNSPQIAQASRQALARHTVFRQGDTLDAVSVVCDGWACAFVGLPDGRRQILRFMLPGEFVAASLVFEPTLRYGVSAITDICYRRFNRSEFRTAVLARPETTEIVALALVREKHEIDRLAVDLGQRTAVERIASLILNLVQRLSGPATAQGKAIAFPLRQTHIADATGLTPVHVSKVLGDLRRSAVIEIGDRLLKIVDPGALRRLAAR